MTRFIPLFALVALLVAPASLHAQSETAWLDRVQSRYAELDGLQAEYRQVVTSPLDDGTTERTGMLYVTPQAFRVEGDGQTVVSNPTTTYVYNRMRGQVIISNADAEEGDWARPTTLFAQFSDAFTLEGSEAVSNGTRRLTLQANAADADYETLVLWVRERDTVITQLELTDFSGTHIRIHLSNIVLNPDLGDALFTFDPPSAAEVVDLRDNV